MLRFFHRRREDQERKRELEDYLARETEENIAQGMTPDEARRVAHMKLGNMRRIREEIREMNGIGFLETLWQDVKYAARMLRKSPGFTVVAVLTLALGIGANTAIFSMIDAVFLDKLPYPHADRIVMVWEDVHLPHYQDNEDTPAPGNFADWRKQNTVFSGMAATRYLSWNVTGAGEPVRVEGDAFSTDIFQVLGIYPMLGRAFTSEEDRPGASHVALIGYALWKSRFGGDASAVGRTIQLDDENYRVIGVLPPSFQFPDPGDQIFVPLALTEQQLANHGSHYLIVLARMKDKVTLAQAQSQMTVIGQRLTQEHPDSNTGVGVNVVPMREQFAGNLTRPLFVLWGVVGLLLLMVCANVANLLFARASVRGREFAIRAALGASRRRVVGQLLVESVLLAGIGGGLGLLLAFWGVDALGSLAVAPKDYNLTANQALTSFHLNWTVVLFTAGISLLAGVIFGLAPAFQSSRRDISGVLQEGARGAETKGQLRAHGLLVIAEMALGVVVLVGTGLLLRSFVRLTGIPVGFDAKDVLTFRVILRGPRYATLVQQTAIYKRAIERLSALPGVQSAAGISFLPLTLQGRTTGISIEGSAPTAAGQLPFADFRSVSPGYFKAMKIPIVQGREFTWDDTAQRPLEAVVSETMARAFWPKGDALGKRFKLGPTNGTDPWITAVGVAADVRQLSLTVAGRPAMYFAVTQDPGIGDTLRDWVIRAPNAAALAPEIRSTFAAIDPSLPVSRVKTMSEILSDYLGPQRFELSLVGLFGIAGLILAAVGIFGVTSYAVARRTHEIGVRVALGAQRSDVMRLILGQGTRLALWGVGIGLLAALGLTRLMASLLYGVSAYDPLTFAGVAILLGLVALAACYVPARRAMRVDPMVALRYE
ncbi:MAG TPA: ABC transporter permease [Candidatus Acidoferrales bacterium]|nr:ABC transporter permease [Candidatus Acidoferrales bacterium]